jgi:small-conductance mechanosensitive channel
MSDMQKDDELDRMLARSFGPPHARAAHAESIEPSSGFAASVMERVREEAAASAALGPIRFPWRRAVPGICMVVLAVAVCATLLTFASMAVAQLASRAFATATVAPQGAATEWVETAVRLHLGWLVIAVLIAFVPFLLTRGLMEGRQRI